jgi:uncharacterized protein involved in outer membrane biogenesis
MGRIIKWAAGIILLVIVVMVISVYVILSRFDLNELKPHISKAVLESTGRELTINGDINLDIGFTPILVLTDISFQNAPWGSRPEMAKLKRFEIQVAILPLIRGNIEIKRFILIEPDILVETNKHGDLNLVFETPEKTEIEEKETRTEPEDVIKLPVLTFNKLGIEDGRITYRDGKSGKTINVNLNRLTATAEGMDSPVEVSLNGDINAELFEAKGILGPLRGLTNPEEVWPVKLEVEALNSTLNLEGGVEDVLAGRGIEMDFRIQIQDWTELSRFTGSPIPVKETFDFSGHAKDTGIKSYSMSDLKIRLGSNEINGSTLINMAEKKPYLEANLYSELIDLRPILSKEGVKENQEISDKEPTKKREKLFPDNPLPLEGLNLVDGIFNIRVNKMILPQLVIDNLEVGTELKGAQLDVQPLKASIGGGTLKGDMSLKALENSADLAALLEIDSLNIGNMLKDLGITDVLEGDLEVDLDLMGKGDSIATLMAGLNGHVSIIMSQGWVKNKYIGLIGRDMSNSIFRLFNPVKEKKDFTEFKCIVSRFDMTKGLAKSTVLLFDTNAMNVVGEGNIDLRTEKLDLALKPVPKEGIGGFTLSLSELAKPFKLGGTLAKPSLAIDATRAATTLGKALGSVALFGPLGLASILVGKSKGGDVDLCAAAVEVARTGVIPSESKETEKEDGEPRTIGETIKDTIRGVGESLKGLFQK